MHSIGAPVENIDTAARITEIKNQHHALEERLDALNATLHLTPDEDLEVHRIKRDKLTLKDQLLALESQG